MTTIDDNAAWEQRLREIKANAVAKREQRAQVRKEFKAARDAGLRQRHAEKIARGPQPGRAVELTCGHSFSGWGHQPKPGAEVWCVRCGSPAYVSQRATPAPRDAPDVPRETVATKEDERP